MRSAAQQQQHSEAETSPNASIDSPEQHQIMTTSRHSHKMARFNWKANWEILLVFVIIIVGIVITTIAAIRSKDKHLLVAPEESDDYAGLMGLGLSSGPGNGDGGDLTSSLQVPPLPQTDFQLHNTHHLPGRGESEGQQPEQAQASTAPATRRPPHLKKASTATPTNAQNPHYRRHHQSAASLAAINRHSLPIVLSTDSTDQDDTSRPSRLASSGRVNQSRQSTTTTTTSLPSSSGSGGLQDTYDAMSTEPTPSQVARSNSSTNFLKSSMNGRRHAWSNSQAPKSSYQQAAVASEQPSHEDFYQDQQLTDNNQDQKDDAHTTRSSIGSTSSTGLPTDANDQNNNDAHQAHQLQEPYELQTQHQQQGRLKLNASPSPLDAEDMMTSYSRMPQNNLTDALLQDYNLASATFNASTTFAANPPADPTTLVNEFTTSAPVQSGARGHRSPVPFSMLLNHLIKLTPPSSIMVSSQAHDLEQPANSRPQFGILQQLRSLPAPMLALFQGGANSQQGDSLSLHPHLSSHDASESSPNFQRISMSPSGMGAILSRSLRATNPLPAYPPPKGTPQTWVAPNSGGQSILNEAASSTADFVASNTAGFVRSGSLASGGSSFAQQQVATDSSSLQQPNIGYHHPLSDTDPQPQQPPQTQQPQQLMSSTVGSNQQLQQRLPISQQYAPAAQMQQKLVQYPASGPMQMANNGGQSRVLMNNINNNVQQLMPTQQQQLQLGVQAPTYNSRQINSEKLEPTHHVPLGYNNMQQQQQFLNYPKSIAEVAQRANAISSMGGGVSALQAGQTIQLNTVNRVRRSVPPDEDEPRISGGGDDDDGDEYLDSRPLSVVRLDGRPMGSGDAKLMRARSPQKTTLLTSTVGNMTPASSRRKVEHADLNESALHHYASYTSPSSSQDGGKSVSVTTPAASSERWHDSTADSGDLKTARVRHELAKEKRGLEKAHVKKLKLNTKPHRKSTRGDHQSRKSLKHLQSSRAHLETAGSGLMSKLLGTASANDELEDDNTDDDEDEQNSAHERRKEELEDAEFGLVNDERSAGPQSSNELGDGGDVSRLTHQDASSGHQDGNPQNDLPPIRSAQSTDSNAYTRRNHQQQTRPDVEFYGHPGEETRQLKYGILGSGNYEVVNGGIYPDIDESTAAVNSVANYVRKPGGVLLANLPKLLGATSGQSSSDGDERQAPFGYMPGGRMSSGFMRGASAASPDEMIGFYPPPTPTAHDDGGGDKLMTNPLLDMLDAAHGHGPFFDPNLVAQLGSSGTSARTTHASRNEPSELGDNRQTSNEGDDTTGKLLDGVANKKRKLKFKKRKQSPNDYVNQTTRLTKVSNKNEVMTTLETLNDGSGNRVMLGSKDGQHDESSPQPKRNNQFYSYQILPSKKVTIYSDQDLDSAPSEKRATVAMRA